MFAIEENCENQNLKHALQIQFLTRPRIRPFCWTIRETLSAWSDRTVGHANDASARFNDAVRSFLYRPLSTQLWPSNKQVVLTLDSAAKGTELAVPWLIEYQRGFGNATMCLAAPPTPAKQAVPMQVHFERVCRYQTANAISECVARSTQQSQSIAKMERIRVSSIDIGDAFDCSKQHDILHTYYLHA